MTFLLFLLILPVAFGVLILLFVKKRNMHIWLPAYILRKRPNVEPGPIHIMFSFVDHFEPGWKRPDYATEVRRVNTWCERYPQMADRHADADGVKPQHTFYYPEEEYRKEHLEKIADLCERGYGEVEVHLHHDDDTADGLREKINRFVKVLHNEHGLLTVDPKSGRPVFGFIHGNWCLDNSRKDGRWCGVNNELDVLRELGCYADFTLPSAPSDTQTAKINSIYYAIDDPVSPKSHNRGVDMRTGSPPLEGLPVFQGPLALNWRKRKWGVLPKIENSDVRASFPPTPDRVDLWVEQHIHIPGRPNWIFIKVHTHGTQDHDMETLLGKQMDDMHTYLESRYNDGKSHVLHYVNSREMFNIAKAAESGKKGNPAEFRDFVFSKPGYQAAVLRE